MTDKELTEIRMCIEANGISDTLNFILNEYGASDEVKEEIKATLNDIIECWFDDFKEMEEED